MSEEGRPEGRNPLGDGTSLALYFPIAIALGLGLGRWIGGYFGRPVAGMVIGVVWGLASACYEFWKVYRRLSKGDGN